MIIGVDFGLGKGEVLSSILSGSTIQIKYLAYLLPVDYAVSRRNRARKDVVQP